MSLHGVLQGYLYLLIFSVTAVRSTKLVHNRENRVVLRIPGEKYAGFICAEVFRCYQNLASVLGKRNVCIRLTEDVVLEDKGITTARGSNTVLTRSKWRCACMCVYEFGWGVGSLKINFYGVMLIGTEWHSAWCKVTEILESI
jgi:hypothetical protein